MSIAAVKWAFRQEGLTPVAKLILVRLAEYADDDGVCFPKREDVARECGVDISSVTRAFQMFRESGVFAVEKVKRRNRYTLHLDAEIRCERHPKKGATCTVSGGKGARGTPEGCDMHPSKGATCTVPYIDKPPIKPPRNHQENSHSDAFEEFWKAYPHPRNRGSKKKARQRWARVKDPPAVMRGVANYAAYCASESHWYSPKMAEGWLNGENWENWQEPPKNEYTRTINADRIDAIVNGRDPDAGDEAGEHIWPEIEQQGNAGEN